MLYFKFVMLYCIVKSWIWQFLFILLGMICLMTNSISYGCITRSGLFKFSVNEWINDWMILDSLLSYCSHFSCYQYYSCSLNLKHLHCHHKCYCSLKNILHTQYSCILTLRLLMSYIYGAPILDVSRSRTMTHHSR